MTITPSPAVLEFQAGEGRWRVVVSESAFDVEVDRGPDATMGNAWTRALNSDYETLPQMSRVIGTVARAAIEAYRERLPSRAAPTDAPCVCDWDHTGHVSHRMTDPECPKHGEGRAAPPDQGDHLAQSMYAADLAEALGCDPAEGSSPWCDLLAEVKRRIGAAPPGPKCPESEDGLCYPETDGHCHWCDRDCTAELRGAAPTEPSERGRPSRGAMETQLAAALGLGISSMLAEFFADLDRASEGPAPIGEQACPSAAAVAGLPQAPAELEDQVAAAVTARRAGLHKTRPQRKGAAPPQPTTEDAGDCDACGDPMATGDVVEVHGQVLGGDVERYHQACYEPKGSGVPDAPGWTLHRLYSVTRTREATATPSERYGQALFNTLVQVRPDIAERLRGTQDDPFHANGGDERATRAITVIESMWGGKVERGDPALHGRVEALQKKVSAESLQAAADGYETAGAALGDVARMLRAALEEDDEAGVDAKAQAAAHITGATAGDYERLAANEPKGSGVPDAPGWQVGDRYTAASGYDGVVVDVHLDGRSLYGCEGPDRLVYEYGADDACCRPLSELRKVERDAGLRRRVEAVAAMNMDPPEGMLPLSTIGWNASAMYLGSALRAALEES